MQTQSSATHIDAATLVCTFSPSPVAVAQQETVTCTPPNGQYVYITGLSFDVCTNGTGTAANQVTWTSTNLPALLCGRSRSLLRLRSANTGQNH